MLRRGELCLINRDLAKEAFPTSSHVRDLQQIIAGDRTLSADIELMEERRSEIEIEGGAGQCYRRHQQRKLIGRREVEERIVERCGIAYAKDEIWRQGRGLRRVLERGAGKCEAIAAAHDKSLALPGPE